MRAHGSLGKERRGLLPVKRLLCLAGHTHEHTHTHRYSGWNPIKFSLLFTFKESWNAALVFTFFSFFFLHFAWLYLQKSKHRTQSGRIIRTSLWFQSAEQKIQWTKEKEKKIIEQETQTKEGHWKNSNFFLFCFSSSKNNAQLVPQYLKKLKTLQNISFIYIYLYLYLYLYLYNLLFFIFQTAAVSVWVGVGWRPGEIPTEPQSETQTQVELFWQAMAALYSLKHTMHMILASLSVHTKTVCNHVLHTFIETNRKRAWLRNVSPLDVQLSVEHPPLPDVLHPPGGSR